MTSARGARASSARGAQGGFGLGGVVPSPAGRCRRCGGSSRHCGLRRSGSRSSTPQTSIQGLTGRWRVPADREPAYRLLDAMDAGEVDAVTFTSAPAVRNLLALADAADRGDETREAFNRRQVVAACVGPVCARSARDEGIESPVAPDVGRLGLLVRSLSEELARRRIVLDGDGEPVTIQGAAVERGGHVVMLSARERAVLRCLVEAGGATVGKTVLFRRVWRAPADRAAHVVEVTVGRLRRRLAPLGVSVVTVARRGYRLETGPLPRERSGQE